MTFIQDGLIQQFLNLLGVNINNATGYYIAFIIASAVFAVITVCLALLIFRFLVYLRKG